MADATAKAMTADSQENPVMHGLRDGGQAAMDELGAEDPVPGAVLTQLASVSVLFVAAATFGTSDEDASLGSVGQISEALTPHLGVTAIVCSLALAWALGAAGYSRSVETQPFREPWFYGVYAA
jgi:hypothetical protein